MYGYIYKTTNLINNKFYVGKHKYPTNEIDPRYYGSGKRLKEAINKYGKENFIVEILDTCETLSEANEKEKFWIEKLNARNREIAYNISFGGDANVPYECLLEGAKKRIGRKASKETKVKISNGLKGKPKSNEHKKHLSDHHRLKTVHIKYYKDGSYELTDVSVANIAKTINVTCIQLRRASELGSFRCGNFYLLDLTDFSRAFDHQFRYSKEKCFFDPIKKDIVSHNTLRIRHQHHMDEYKDVNLYNYTQEKLEEKNNFIQYYTKIREKILKEGKEKMMKLSPIITHLTDTDLYKFTMLQTMWHRHPNLNGTYLFKCRNEGVTFTPEMVDEINTQIDHLCTLTFTDEELDYLRSLRFIKSEFVEFLRLWHPLRRYVRCHGSAGDLYLEVSGPLFSVMQFEIYLLEIVNEVYFRMKYDYLQLIDAAKEKLYHKTNAFRMEEYDFKFAEFGCRRRLSREWQDYVVGELLKTGFCVGTSNVFLAMKYGCKPIGTYAHEYVQMFQGIPGVTLAYTNKMAMDEWFEEYQGDNGTALTDTLGTDLFLMDFNKLQANCYTGVRHDSGDPIEWGEKIIAHYEKLGIDPKTKTLLFSDSLNFVKAQSIYNHFRGRINVSFGIGTYLSNDTNVDPLNIVIKLQYVNGHPVAKLSDVPGKTMCQDDNYITYLKNSVDYRIKEGI